MRLFNFLHFNRGFTFIELVMVISIFTILSGVALFNFGDYSDSIALQNLAQQISLEIVQAQRDAISGRNPNAFGSFRPSYGVVFSTDETCVSESPCSKKFIVFTDKNNDGLFSSSYEPSTEIEMTRGNKISSLDPSPLTITFCRPYPDAYIQSTGFFNSCLNRISLDLKAEITIESLRGNHKTIEVSSLGQVSVKNYEP